jgi:hypothetical protein
LTLSPADQSSFPVIPVDVAPGTARIEVAYAVRAHGPGECVVDIGLRDGDGFRGWSGSARRSFFVAPHQATPGYLPGALVPGRWEVVLGAYKVPPDGCTVEVTVTLERAQPQWLVGDLHAHSVHSDGQLTLEQLCALAIGHGLDFLALTDHNTVSQTTQAPRGLPLVLLEGLELTTYRGHANVYGRFCRPFDFRSCDDAGMRCLFEDARAQGAFISLNHPFDAGCGWRYSFDLPCDAIEIWNGPWRRHNAAALHYWHEQLVAGRRLIALGGTDFHRLPAATMRAPVANRILAAERSVPALLAGMRSGHVVVTNGLTAPCVRLELGGCIVGETATVTGAVAPLLLHVDTSESCRVRLITDRGVESEHQVAQEAWTLDRCVPTDRRFYRVEVWSQEGERDQPLALTNPIFLTTDGP